MFNATAAGREAAAAVIAGTMTPEEAGDAWVEIADRSHDDGVSFLSAYDHAGGTR